jgi:transposase
MGNGSGVSRGDRNRNARLERLRCLVPVRNAMAGSIWQARGRWSW